MSMDMSVYAYRRLCELKGMRITMGQEFDGFDWQWFARIYPNEKSILPFEGTCPLQEGPEMAMLEAYRHAKNAMGECRHSS